METASNTREGSTLFTDDVRAGLGEPTPAYLNRRERINAILVAAGDKPIPPPPTKAEAAKKVAEMIDDGKALFKRIEFAMRKRYAADYKDYRKRFDDILEHLANGKMTNVAVVELLMALNKEIREHPVYKDVSADESVRDSMLQMFGANHCICIFGGRTCIRREDANEWILPDQARAYWQHVDLAGTDGRRQSLVSAFMDWPEARRYDEVIFDPSRKGHYDCKFNLWQGWMVEPEEGNHDAMWWDVLAAACGYNSDYIDYVSKWFADIIQNPTRKPGTAIGITGRQGIGKSALVETVGMLMSTINRADNTAAIRGAYGDFDLDELLAEYNEHIANKLLVYLDEATWGGSHQEAKEMKKIITKRDENINPKFLGRIRVPCYHRVVFSSNDDFYYRPDKDDRRLLPLEYDTSKINDKTYDFWKQFYEARDHGKMLQNLLFHLQQLDLAGWEPQTALKKLKIVTGGSMLANTLQRWEHWLEEIAFEGEITVEVEGEHGKLESRMSIANQTIADDNFKDAYLLWARKHKCSADWYADAFRKERSKMLGEGVRKMIDGRKFVVRNVPDSDEMLKRLREGRRWEV